jgi:hypothetical protein
MLWGMVGACECNAQMLWCAELDSYAYNIKLVNVLITRTYAD